VDATSTADVALDLVSVDWERIQVTLRARLGGRTLEEVHRFRLECRDGHHQVMAPTRAWVDGETLALRFNVMQGPGQDPLAPGLWTLTVAPTAGGTSGRGRPVRIGEEAAVDPDRLEGRFEVDEGTYRAVPSVDPATHAFTLRIVLERGSRPPSGVRRRPWWRVQLGRTARALRPIAFRAILGGLRIVARRNGRRILFTSDSHDDLAGNMALVHDRMVARGLDGEFELSTLFRPSIMARRSLRDRLRLPWVLARADTIVIDDFQPVIHHLRASEVRIVQLWHASGAFKTVGYSRIGKEGGPGPWSRVHKNYTRAIVSSDHDVASYAEAFGIPEARVIPTGIPRMDRFFDPALREAGLAAAHDAFPATRGRFTILFAPTFRGEGPRDASYDPAWLDLPALHALALERDAVVIVKMHPFVRGGPRIPEALQDRLIDGSGSRLDVNDLLFAVDLLVTDYSSIVFEFSTLGRPMLFYAPDLEEYVAARDFYEPFETFVPGRIVTTFDALLDAIRRGDHEAAKVTGFADRHFAHLDGMSTDRVIDDVLLRR
jgi:CDP-ribitol ribitolphosphotransferase / teichoic acid ribitol-phosphate polymerase